MISFLGMIIGGGLGIWWVFYRDSEEEEVEGAVKQKPRDERQFQNKDEIAKHLMKKRVRQNPELNMDENTIDALKGMKLAGMPESTIVAIVELYARLKEQGISDNKIFEQFEDMRSGSGRMPSPLTLKSYINYRIELEHGNGVGLTKSFVADAIDICSKHYHLQ